MCNEITIKDLVFIFNEITRTYPDGCERPNIFSLINSRDDLQGENLGVTTKRIDFGEAWHRYDPEMRFAAPIIAIDPRLVNISRHSKTYSVQVHFLDTDENYTGCQCPERTEWDIYCDLEKLMDRVMDMFTSYGLITDGVEVKPAHLDLFAAGLLPESKPEWSVKVRNIIQDPSWSFSVSRVQFNYHGLMGFTVSFDWLTRRECIGFVPAECG